MLTSTDMVDSTALTQRLGDEQAQEAVRQHNTVVREALRANGGSEIKHTGDGIMASFASARGAVDCAIAIQRALAAGDAVRVRIGLNAGEPVAEEQDLYGTSVQLAARVCAARSWYRMWFESYRRVRDSCSTTAATMRSRASRTP